MVLPVGPPLDRPPKLVRPKGGVPDGEDLEEHGLEGCGVTSVRLLGRTLPAFSVNNINFIGILLYQDEAQITHGFVYSCTASGV